jgi:hypothetical protein
MKNRYLNVITLIVLLMLFGMLVGCTNSTEDSKDAEQFEGIANSTLNSNFVAACDEISLEISEIDDFEMIDDWVGGERYSFSYYRHPMTLFANADNTVSSINIGDIKVYCQGFEPYSIDDFIVDMDIAEQLILDSEDYVKSNLNYPSSADFSLLNWSYGRERNYYQLSSSVEAENAFGVKSEIPFTIIYNVNGDAYTVAAFILDGTWVIENEIPRYDQGRKEIASASSDNEIKIIDGALGTYGKTVQIDSYEYVWYQVPAGTYTVKSNVDWCVVYVDKNQTIKNSDGYTEAVNVETLEFDSANQEKTISIASDEHIFLTVNASITLIKQ